MKTMIANAEKLEKLGELIEVDGNNVAFGGNVEVDGSIKSNEMSSKVVTIQGSDTGVYVNLPLNYLYSIYFVQSKASVTIPILMTAQSPSSSLGFDDNDGETFFVSYSKSNNALNFYTTSGGDKEISGDIVIIPIAYIN